jgi:hypothetical protein
MRRLFYFVLFGSLIIGLWECQKSISPDNIPFTTRIKDDSTLFLLVNDTLKIKVTPVDAKVSFIVNVDNTYKEPRNGVITVLPDGIIKALEPGKASIAIKNNSGNITFNIIVVELPLKIQLKDSSILIKTGRNTQLDLSQVYDQYENKCFGGFKWEISDKTIATVSDLGKITALKEGTTKVRISIGNYPNVYSEYTVQIMDHIVYVLGECQNDNNFIKPCYWENNLKVESGLETIAFTAQNILYSNNNIYIVGRTLVSDKAYMLKSTTETIFIESGAGATGVATIGEDIYTCGYYSFSGIHTVALWKNATLSPILDNSEIISESIGTTITSSDGNIYVGGYIKNNQGKQVACYWKNKQRNDLTDGLTDAIVNSIFVDGTDVYAAGHYTAAINNIISTVACYWKNGVKLDLSSYSAEAYSIYISKGSVFISGNYSTSLGPVACYWKNGGKTDLNLGNGAKWSNTSCIKIVDDNVFISGFYINSSDKPTGCYWKNGIRYDLPPTKFKNGIIVETYPYSYAHSLAID